MTKKKKRSKGWLKKKIRSEKNGGKNLLFFFNFKSHYTKGFSEKNSRKKDGKNLAIWSTDLEKKYILERREKKYRICDRKIPISILKKRGEYFRFLPRNFFPISAEFLIRGIFLPYFFSLFFFQMKFLRE